MRWKGGRRSDNVEDRRGVRMSRGAAGGGIGALLLVLVALYFGVDPSDSFTHGSSAQRVYWFRQGIEAGDTGQCNTFTAERF